MYTEYQWGKRAKHWLKAEEYRIAADYWFYKAMWSCANNRIVEHDFRMKRYNFYLELERSEIRQASELMGV